ncbi:MAG: ATP-binding cassette domain-containing protein [Pirellulaceae bacterium]
MTDSALFHLRNVRKRLGAFTLDLHQVDVQAGELLALLGPTGAGKTTLLRLLAGLARADEGELVFAGHSLHSTELPLAVRRRLTLVHQRPLLLSGTVRFNVEYGLRLRKRRDLADPVDAMLERLGLAKLQRQAASTLSGGQSQLVALARALVIEPEVLLLDEPTAHLDPAHVALVETTIREVQRERPMTVVWATHNLFQARRVADRTALLLNGRLVEAGPTEEFFTRPSDPRTADFVEGRMVY